MSTALKGSLIIGQSGGPSSVINSSAYGVIRTALDSDCITKVYGAYHGIKGVLDDQLLCKMCIRDSNRSMEQTNMLNYVKKLDAPAD